MLVILCLQNFIKFVLIYIFKKYMFAKKNYQLLLNILIVRVIIREALKINQLQLLHDTNN